MSWSEDYRKYDFLDGFLERGMPIEQIQKFLGHSKLETTQVYAESSTAMMRERVVF